MSTSHIPSRSYCELSVSFKYTSHSCGPAVITRRHFSIHSSDQKKSLRHYVQAGSGASCVKGNGVFSTRAKEAEDSLVY